MRKHLFKYLLILFTVCTILAVIISNIKDKAIYSSANANCGTIIVSVQDSLTNKPIDNATICILELHAYYKTDKYGNTTPIMLPVDEKQETTKIIEDAEYYTILAYKAGFADHIFFNVKIKRNQTKVGFIIELTEIVNESDNKPTISTEAPTKSWAETIIAKYKK